MEPLARSPSVSLVQHFLQDHLFVGVLAGLAVVNFFLYLPALTAYFISDDFQYISYLYDNIKLLLDGQRLDFWFIGGMDGYLYFRPAGHALVLLDYLAWNLDPFGYHLTNLLLQILVCAEVFLLCLLLLTRRSTALLAAALFAVLPVHAGAVAWVAARYDVLAGLYYFAALIFFIFSIQRRNFLFYLVSLALMAGAVASKETAITLPAALLLYDLLFNAKHVRSVALAALRNLPFWLVLGARFYYFGQGYRGFQIIPEGFWYWADLNLAHALDPLLSDVGVLARWIILGFALLLPALARPRRPVVFALGWLAITALPTITSGPSDRSFYIPSFGLVFLSSVLLSEWVSQPQRALAVTGTVVLIVCLAGYGVALFNRNRVYHRAGEIARAIPEQVIALHPTLPPEARLIFVGVPDYTPEGVLVYLSGFPGLLRTAYPGQELQVFKFDKFPLWLDGLERTFFFQVDHRRVFERSDLLKALNERLACENSSAPALEWDFRRDAQGWEAWNELSDLEVRAAELTTRSWGSDPFMASPPVNIPSIAIGDIDLTMRVQSIESKVQGQVYWRATGQGDFSPDLKVDFSIVPDGALRTYRFDLAQSGKLLLEDEILQFRLDPADAPADIGIASFRIYSHCSTLEGEHCGCGR